MANSYDIGKEILDALENYSNEVCRRVNISAQTCAAELQKELRSTSPKKTGDYAKGWRIKKDYKSEYRLGRFVVYNKTDYQLTHLLEYGHAIDGGTRRVKAHPHIAAAKEKAVNNFVREVEKAIEEAGK